MKKLSKEPELAALRDRALTILHFLETQLPPGNDRRLFEDIEGVIARTYQSHRQKGMLMVVRELEEWARGLSEDKRAELEQLLVDRRDVVGERDSSHLASVLERGRIVTKEEYAVLLTRADALFDQPDRASELRRIDELLARFENEPTT